MNKITNIEIITFEKFFNKNTNNDDETAHYIIDFENDIYEFGFNIDLNKYIKNNYNYNNKKFEKASSYWDRGFFITDIFKEDLNIFNKKYSKMFYDDLIIDLNSAYNECILYLKKNRDIKI